MNKPTVKTERQSNLELLRILAALFVIILHYNNASMGKAFTYTEGLPVHHQILLLFEMIAISSVNIFVMLSGYFLCTATKVRVWKILRLYADVFFVAVVYYLLCRVLGPDKFKVANLTKIFFPLNWYTAIYSGLYLISPYLNQIIKNKTKDEYHQLLLVFFFVFSLWPTGVESFGKVTGFPVKSFIPISSNGSGDGYTLVNFILMYFFGAYFRQFEGHEPCAKCVRNALIVLIVSILLNTVLVNYSLGRATAYCNPFVIMQAVAWFAIFQNIRIQSKAVNAVAGCSFGVYLMHGFLFPWFQIEKYVTGNPVLIPFHLIICAVVIYAVSAAVYLGYQKIFSPVFTLLQKKLAFLSYEVR